MKPGTERLLNSLKATRLTEDSILAWLGEKNIDVLRISNIGTPWCEGGEVIVARVEIAFPLDAFSPETVKACGLGSRDES